MKIEVGRCYVTRDGRVTTPLEKTGGKRYAWAGLADGISCTWRKDGKYWESGDKSTMDLIKEHSITLRCARCYNTVFLPPIRKGSRKTTSYSGVCQHCKAHYGIDFGKEKT
jgi:hypothetical protein